MYHYIQFERRKLIKLSEASSILRSNWAGCFTPLAVIVIMMLIGPRMEVSGTNYLPDELYLSENAAVVMEQTDKAKVEISQSGEMPVLYVTATALGEYPFSIVDGEKTYHYILVVDENDNGSTEVDIIRAE